MVKRSGVGIEVIKGEQTALQTDRELYLECMKNKPFANRHTTQEIRDGLILFWHVYRKIKTNQLERV